MGRYGSVRPHHGTIVLDVVLIIVPGAVVAVGGRSDAATRSAAEGVHRRVGLGVLRPLHAPPGRFPLGFRLGIPP
jgi:hypothetical protein